MRTRCCCSAFAAVLQTQVGPSIVVDYYTKQWFGGGGEIGTKMSEDPLQRQLRIDTWKGLSTLRDKGLIHNIGVSNFNIQHMQEIQALDLAPIATNQMQVHPWAPEWSRAIVRYCHENRIVVTGYFSLGGTDNKHKTLELEVLSEIARAHDRRPAQILLRWSLQKNISIIPGTGNPRHMAENLGTYGFSLSDADMAKLDAMSALPVKESFVFFDL